MSERIPVLWMEKTCGACPAQWEGMTTDGRAIYARFRFGYGYVCVAPKGEEGLYGDDKFKVVEWEGEDPLMGFLTEEQLVTQTEHVLAYPPLGSGGWR